MRIGLLASVGQTLDAFFPEMVNVWKEHGDEVYPAAGTGSTLPGAEIIEGITRKPSLANVIAPASIRRWISRHDLDIVVTNTATASALARLQRMSVPVVYFCHGLHWDDPRNSTGLVWRLLEARFLRNTAGVITINSDDSAWFKDRMPESKVLYLRGGVGVPLERYPRTDLPGWPPVHLLWIGELSPRKRPSLMIDIAQRLLEHSVDFRLTMLGDGELRNKLREEVAVRGMKDVITLPGRLPVQHWIAASHLLVHTAAWEGLPRVLLEGYAMGRRAVAFDVKGVRDVPGVILAEKGNTDQIVAIIIDCLRDSENLLLHDDPSWIDVRNAALRVRGYLSMLKEHYRGGK